MTKQEALTIIATESARCSKLVDRVKGVDVYDALILKMLDMIAVALICTTEAFNMIEDLPCSQDTPKTQ